MVARVNNASVYPYKLYGRTSQAMTATQIRELNQANQPSATKKKETSEAQQRKSFVDNLAKKYPGITFGIGKNAVTSKGISEKPAVNLAEELVDKMRTDSRFAKKMETKIQNAAEMQRGAAANAAAAGASYESLAVNFDKDGKAELNAKLSDKKPDYSTAGAYQRYLMNAGRENGISKPAGNATGQTYKVTAATDAYDRVKNSLNQNWAEKPKTASKDKYAGIDDAYGRIARSQEYQRYSRSDQLASGKGIRDSLLQNSYKNSFTADPFSYRGGMNYFL